MLCQVLYNVGEVIYNLFSLSNPALSFGIRIWNLSAGWREMTVQYSHSFIPSL